MGKRKSTQGVMDEQCPCRYCYDEIEPGICANYGTLQCQPANINAEHIIESRRCIRCHTKQYSS